MEGVKFIMKKVNAMTEKQVEDFCNAWPSGYKKVNAMAEKQIQEFYDNCPDGYEVEETRIFDMLSFQYVTVSMRYI